MKEITMYAVLFETNFIETNFIWIRYFDSYEEAKIFRDKYEKHSEIEKVIVCKDSE